MGLSGSLQILLGGAGSSPRTLRKAHPAGRPCPCPRRLELLGRFLLFRMALLLFCNCVRNVVCLALCAVPKLWQTARFLPRFTFYPHPPPKKNLFLFFIKWEMQEYIYKREK